MSFSTATKVFIVSTLAVPLSYASNQLFIFLHATDSFIITIISLFILLIISAIILWLTRAHLPTHKKHERIDFYLFSIFSFTSVVSLITGLELDGIISGFMNSFLKYGEPHLRSSYGTIMCYWNGTGTYAMYLMMIAAITWANDFLEVSLYWFGSTENSILVVLLSIANGRYGFNWGFILYLPFLIAPPLIILKLFKYGQMPSYQNNGVSVTQSIYKRPKDCLLIVYLLASICISLLRGIAVLHHNDIYVCNHYIKHIEPYLTLKDPAPYGKMQMIIYLFYYTPIYVLSIYALIFPASCSWMPRLSLIHAGASMQAQITHIGSSIHSRTPYIQRVPQDIKAQLIFWSINLLLLVGPQLLSLRCANAKEFYTNTKISNGFYQNNQQQQTSSKLE